MSDNFESAFAHVVGIEGRYSNHPADNGGETMYGITIAVARAAGYTAPMKDMPLIVAQQIYRTRYWDAMKCDHLTFKLAEFMFDMAVNSGVGAAAKALQKAIGVLPDGEIGPKTLAALRNKDPDDIVRLAFVTRAKIFAHHPDRDAFENGWFARLFDVTARYFGRA
jgi:lysozyme family protein